jgi:Ankyrin repeats (3 copies)
VVCQLDELSKCLTRSMIKKTLNTLPQTLDETYERILCGIDPKYSDFTSRVLQWLAFSTRDLTPREAAHIIAIDVENGTFDPDDILEDPLDVLLLCPSLVTLHYWKTGYPKSIVLAHYSVKEFLISKRMMTGMASNFCFDERQAHGFIGSCCLVYMLHWPDGLNEDQSFTDLRLHRYARNNCWEHIRNAGKLTPKASQLAWQLFSSSETFSLIIGYPFGVKSDQHRMQFRLWFACQNDLDEIVRRLIESGTDVNGEICRNLGILSEAVGLNRVKVVDTLLSMGVDVNAISKSRESWRATALMTACDDSNETMVRKLLQAGADPNFQNEAGETALSQAQMISEAGETALSQAQIIRNDTIMEMLLAHGAHASSADIAIPIRSSV